MAAARAAQTDPQWFSVRIRVDALPKDAQFVPVAWRVDFSELLRELHQTGAVDELSLRLYHLLPNRQEQIPYQFSPFNQPRARQRHWLGDSPANVSYLGEYAAGQSPGAIEVAGELAWIVEEPRAGSSEYLLKFDKPRTGRAVQLPYPPQDLRVFDARWRTTPPRWFPIMQLHPQYPFEGFVRLFDGQTLVADYHEGPDLAAPPGGRLRVRRPFFYPVIGPDGIGLTGFGKPHDPTGSHAHHNSLWIAHESVNDHDFWSQRGGIIAHQQFDLMEDGPVFSRVIQTTRWIDHGQTFVRGRRTITLYHQLGNFRILDLELALTPAAGKAVTFGKTSFGFLAARVAQSMTVFDGGGEIRNAQGDRNEQGAHLKHSPWLDQSGPVSPRRWGGLAIFDNPKNPNYPTGWHCRNDGWAGAAFNMDGPYTLKPGATLDLRYRVCLHSGDAAAGEVQRRYDEYRAAPVIRISDLKQEK